MILIPLRNDGAVRTERHSCHLKISNTCGPKRAHSVHDGTTLRQTVYNCRHRQSIPAITGSLHCRHRQRATISPALPDSSQRLGTARVEQHSTCIAPCLWLPLGQHHSQNGLAFARAPSARGYNLGHPWLSIKQRLAARCTAAAAIAAAASAQVPAARPWAVCPRRCHQPPAGPLRWL